jgi:hypothetical protein
MIEQVVSLLGIKPDKPTAAYGINGEIHVGDMVLSTTDAGLPCLPGRVIAIELLNTEGHQTENETDDVHVDFRGVYSARRRQEITDYYTALSGHSRSFGEVDYDDMIMSPDCLICITGITPEKLNWICESEENAIRYACEVIANRPFEMRDAV